MIGFQRIGSSLLSSLAVLFGTTLVVFLLFNVLPGDPARLLAGKRASAEQIEILKSEMGLHQSKTQQFLSYIHDLSPISVGGVEQVARWDSRFNIPMGERFLVLKMPYLRKSFVSGERVDSIIWNALLETFVLAFSAILLSLFLGTLLGIWTIRSNYRWRYHVLSFFAAGGLAIPSFLTAIIIAWLFGFVLHGVTGLSMSGSLFTYDVYEGREVLSIRNLILPTIALSLRPMSMVALLTRDSLLEIMQRDFIRTARAKGLKEHSVIFKHALLNAIGPVVTASLTWLVSLLAGSIFVELIFGWKGLGHVVISAIDYYDLPVIMGVTLMVSAFFVLTNWFLDAVYPLIDPTAAAARKKQPAS